METTQGVHPAQGNLCPVSLWNSQNALHQQGLNTAEQKGEGLRYCLWWQPSSATLLVPGLWLESRKYRVASNLRDEGWWDKPGLAGGELLDNQDK